MTVNGFSPIIDKIFVVVLMLIIAAAIAAIVVLAIKLIKAEHRINELSNDIKNTESFTKFLLLKLRHDIRTPVHNITGLCQMIIDISDDSKIIGCAKDSKREASRLVYYIDDIIDLSKFKNNEISINPVRYGTREFLESTYEFVSSFNSAKEIEVSYFIDQKLPSEIFGDENRIKQVLGNLIINAIDYTTAGGMSISIEMLEKRENSAVIRYTVRDTGIGIKEAELENIKQLENDFGKLNSFLEAGSGIGIGVVVKLLEIMGSKINVESEFGGGSEFWFDIEQEVTNFAPIGKFEYGDKHKEVKETKAKSALSIPVAPSAKVLVVDDDTLNLKVISGLLSRTRVQVSKAGGGLEAIDLCDIEQFDLIFMDHLMPDLDGIETFKRLRRDSMLNSNTKCIVLTANAGDNAVNEYKEIGFDDCLFKPVEVELLYNILSKYIEDKIVDEL